MTSITAILTAHAEGDLVEPSLRSLFSAVELARNAGHPVDIILTLDRADEPTSRRVNAAAADTRAEVIACDYGDQAQARNRAIQVARGDYVAFLDGDDLWGENWLVEAFRICAADPGRVIAHPEYNLFFGNTDNVFCHIDQTSEHFDPEALRFENLWDALCLAPRQAYLDGPFAERAVTAGFAYEDWHWNCATLEAGYVHRVVADTIHFKRRREVSQNLLARDTLALVRPTRLFSYRWYEENRSRLTVRGVAT